MVGENSDYTALRDHRDIIGGRKQHWIGGAIALLVHLYCSLLRMRVVSLASHELGEGTVIYCFWHNRVLMPPAIWQRFVPRAGLTCLTSASKDGAITAAVMRAFGIGAIRGSSSRRGKQAMVEMIRTLRSGTSLAITPDGPRGPMYHLDTGVIKLAGKTQTPIIPVQLHYSRYWQLRTWDQFRIPQPFSTVTLELGTPYLPANRLSDDELRASQAELTTALGR